MTTGTDRPRPAIPANEAGLNVNAPSFSLPSNPNLPGGLEKSGQLQLTPYLESDQPENTEKGKKREETNQNQHQKRNIAEDSGGLDSSREDPAENRPLAGYDPIAFRSIPLPAGRDEDLPCAIPAAMDPLSHPAIAGYQMVSFKVELDRDMHQSGSHVGILIALKHLVAELGDGGHGLPTPGSLQSFNWAPQYNNQGWLWAKLALTISTHTPGGIATIATLLRHTHSRWWERDSLLAIPIMDGVGNTYSATITCMEIERHLQSQKHEARLAMHANITKDIKKSPRVGSPSKSSTPLAYSSCLSMRQTTCWGSTSLNLWG